jgi:hypothetical protein
VAAPSRFRDRLPASAATRRKVERVVVIVALKPYPIPIAGIRGAGATRSGIPK